MLERRRRYFVLLLGIIVLWTAALCQPGLNAMRADYQLVATAPLENAPPEVAFSTVALGAFSGLIADFLWMRAMRLQEASKYFEAVQLADWITKLQPRFTAVWLFQAWNMAYNISVEFPDFRDRWLWVQRGIELLRDKGMYYDPSDPDMYRELAWIFLDKMGGQNDDANQYYKRQWAAQMMEVFDGPKPDYTALINAPKTPEELRRDSATAAFIDKLSAAGFDIVNDYFSAREKLVDVPAAAKKIMDDPANKDVLAKVSLYARAKRLRKHYRLDPVLMQSLDKEYGGLEWLLPEAHAVYWATRGIEVAPDEKSINNDRVLLHAVERDFERGRLVMTSDNTMLTTPNPNVIPRLDSLLDHLEKKYSKDNTLASAHASFLREAIRTLWMFNRQQEATAYFKKLQARSPAYRSVLNVDQFVLQETQTQLNEATSRLQALNQINGALYQSYWYLAVGDYDESKGMESFGKLIYINYQNRWVGNAGRALGSFQDIERQMLQQCLKDFPPLLRNRLQKEVNRG